MRVALPTSPGPNKPGLVETRLSRMRLRRRQSSWAESTSRAAVGPTVCSTCRCAVGRPARTKVGGAAESC